ILDLAGSRVAVDEQTGDYPTGAWGDESREYQVAVRVAPAGVGDEMLAGRVTLMVDGEPQGDALIKALWTDGIALSTRIKPHRANYTGQGEMADAIQEGLDARREGDEEMATTKLGLAVRLAVDSDNGAALEMLEKVVDIDDAATGKVRLKSDVAAIDEITLDT